MSSGNAIEVRDLHKTYRPRRGEPVAAVAGLDLHVAEGEILAFLGANGAGKTTTIEILEGFRTRDSGEVRVLGQDPASAGATWRNDIGIMLQECEPDGDLTARESLDFYATWFDQPRAVDEVLELVGLADAADQRATKLSGGQKRRLDLGIALIGDPKLIFLDEPTTGFDPSARRDAWGMIENLRSVGATVLLTTHYMDEAEQLSDRIVVIHDGRVAAEGTAATLADQADIGSRIAWDLDDLALAAVPEALRSRVAVDGHTASITGDDVAEVVQGLSAAAIGVGSQLRSLGVHRPNLEDVFLRLAEEQA